MTPYVWVFGKDGANPRRKAPANLFTENDIYTIELPGGERDLRLEHGFQELEDKFTRIRNLKFNRREWPDPEDMAWVLGFVAAAQARTAGHRDFQRQQWQGIRERMEEFKAAFDNASPERKAAMARMGAANAGASSDSGKGMGIEDVLRLEKQPIQEMIGPTLRSVLPAFRRMHVAVLCSNDELGFVTGDSPCAWFDPEAYKLPPIYRAPALGSPTIEVTLPISPQQCLIITHDPEFEGYVDVDQRVVDELNRRHILHSNERFISHTDIARPAWFEKRPMPDDAWERVRERKTASGGSL